MGIYVDLAQSLISILEDSALEYNAAVLLQALMNLMRNKSLRGRNIRR